MKKNSGATLVELILYIALLSIFIGGAITFAWDIIYSRVKSNTQRLVSQNLRLASRRIEFEIRNASAITVNDSSTITLTMADSTRNPTIIDLNSGRVQIGVGAGLGGQCSTSARCFLTSNELTISNLTFTNLSSGTSTNIKFSITGVASGDTNEFDATQTYTSSVELRL